MKPKENLLRVIKQDGPQWVPNGLESVMWLMPPVVERPVMQTGYDSFGVHWSYNDNPIEGAYPTANGHPIKSIHRWRKEIKLPDVEAMDWNQVRKNYDLFKSVNDIEDWLVMGYIEFCLFERSWLLLGMEEALVAYLAEKELMKELLGAIADYIGSR